MNVWKLHILLRRRIHCLLIMVYAIVGGMFARVMRYRWNPKTISKHEKMLYPPFGTSLTHRLVTEDAQKDVTIS